VSQRDRLLVIVVAALAVFGGGWFGVVKPKQDEASKLDTQIVAAQAELDGASARAAEYRAARKRLRSNPEAFEKAGKALPNRVAMPDLLRTLTRTAKGTGVKMSDLKTSAGTSTTPGISSVGLDLTFAGDFLALQRYLGRLQRFVGVSRDKVDAKGRLVALKSLKLAPGEKGAGLTATVSATVYILQPGALAPGAQAPATGTPVPGAAPAGSTPGAAAAAPATPTTPAGGA
jgi:Tfp pilus assembly protein PilO